MNCVAVTFDDFRPRIEALQLRDCLGFCHSYWNGKIKRVASCVCAVACFRQTLGYQAVLMCLRSKAACWSKS